MKKDNTRNERNAVETSTGRDSSPGNEKNDVWADVETTARVTEMYSSNTETDGNHLHSTNEQTDRSIERTNEPCVLKRRRSMP